MPPTAPPAVFTPPSATTPAAGPAVFTLPAAAAPAGVVVTGVTSAWPSNDYYPVAGTSNGRDFYQIGIYRIRWTGSSWVIEPNSGMITYFSSSENVATPGLVTSWTPGVGTGTIRVINSIAPPAPVFTASGVATPSAPGSVFVTGNLPYTLTVAGMTAGTHAGLWINGSYSRVDTDGAAWWVRVDPGNSARRAAFYPVNSAPQYVLSEQEYDAEFGWGDVRIILYANSEGFPHLTTWYDNGYYVGTPVVTASGPAAPPVVYTP